MLLGESVGQEIGMERELGRGKGNKEMMCRRGGRT